MWWCWCCCTGADLECRDHPEDWELHSTAHSVCCSGGSSSHRSLSRPSAGSPSPAQSLICKSDESSCCWTDSPLTWTPWRTVVQLGVGVDAVHAVHPGVSSRVLVLVWVWAANTGVITVLDRAIFLFWYFDILPRIQIRLCGSLQLWVYLSKTVDDNYHIIMLSTSLKSLTCQK